ncbi:protein mono-ADP-ribosyltransferase PARP14-like [Denticeps clupeoides]|uniref:protein mono-ADP-ribosyltransferase PARP14-like n=1 Tax=Denticeps clupeoides TaxID=299321 RepID=UPI0010A36019|nr:protein mono-ADP-ribosyltransferase PARP14-like [Denticeps clupeoides]
MEHSVFFKAEDLSDKDKERIKNYFKIKRKSGGGECSDVEKVAENCYKISFLQKEDQERVLLRDHEVLLQNQNFHISLSPRATTERGEQALSSDKDVERMKEFVKFEPYLLHYLNDSPKATNDLKVQLSCLCSSFQVLPEQEKIVAFQAAGGPGCSWPTFEKWVMQVEHVIGALNQKYCCHFEVDPERLKIMQQNPTLFSEDLILYNVEVGFAVVVGQLDEVMNLLDAVDQMGQNMHVRKDCDVSKSQYALVQEDFEKDASFEYPHVKVSRDSTETLILEGPEKEVHLASKKLLEKVSNIRRKKIQLQETILEFLVTSGNVHTYEVRFQQSLRCPVMLDIGPDLTLSSTSPQSLDEAAAALERDLKTKTVMLNRAEVESPEMDKLRKALNDALQQANRGGTKVEMTFLAGDASSLVSLVGFSKEVDSLNQLLLDYQFNQAEMSDFVLLPSPAMVDHFSRILQLVTLNCSGLKVAAVKCPSPRVEFSGPRQLVQDFRMALNTAIGGLTCTKWKVEGPGSPLYFQHEGKDKIALLENNHNVVISPDLNQQDRCCRQTGRSSTTPTSSSPIPAQQQIHQNKPDLQVVLGGLEDQKVEVLVSPMLNTELHSTAIGKALAAKGGDPFQQNFKCSKGGAGDLHPGDVLEVDGTVAMGCRKVFFIQCLPWDLRGSGEQALRAGLARVLDLCVHQSWSSVAFAVMGPGIALRTPVREASRILAEEIGAFGHAGTTGSLSTIRVVVPPSYGDSKEIFQGVSSCLSSQILDRSGRAVFRSLTTDLDDVVLHVGGVQLILVFGDITNETTDAVVNSTNFTNFTTGVCKDILTVAGSEVQKNLESAQVTRGTVHMTQSGSFPCRAIMHVCGERDAGVIQGLARDVVLLCERNRYQSVAIPAICAGQGGVDPRVVANAILGGVRAATSGQTVRHVTTVRLVLFQINVFQQFKAEAQSTVGSTPTPLRLSRSSSQRLQDQPPSITPDLSSLLRPASSAEESVTFTLIGLSAIDVSLACGELHQAYTTQCTTYTMTQEAMSKLHEPEVTQLSSRMQDLGIRIEEPSQNGDMVVSGLRNGVNEVIQLVQVALARAVREFEQRDLYGNEANQTLEQGRSSSEVMDGQGRRWNVDLKKMTASAVGSVRPYKLKRLENLSDFTLPLYWDALERGESLQLIALLQSTAEYGKIKGDFKRTAKDKTVMKIERVQNVHLRRAYEVKKRQLEDKNSDTVGAGEKTLYHGTTAQACRCIQENGFNRRFAGQNATLYGEGTYFAVNASYSANPTYSRPGDDGTQLMFVARVLTGVCTAGQSDMKVLPPISSQQPQLTFDSAVDNEQNPNMYVVFHDIQAYPDYLIWFK